MRHVALSCDGSIVLTASADRRQIGAAEVQTERIILFACYSSPIGRVVELGNLVVVSIVQVEARVRTARRAISLSQTCEVVVEGQTQDVRTCYLQVLRNSNDTLTVTNAEHVGQSLLTIAHEALEEEAVSACCILIVRVEVRQNN